MSFSTWLDGLRGLNLAALQIWLAQRDEAISYVSSCVQRADEVLKRGLPEADPIRHLREGLRRPPSAPVCVLPANLHDGGGTRLEELVYLAAAARLLQPRKVFEIGTFKGRTTTVFALNAPEAEILTLDLPDDYTPDPEAYIASDVELVRDRNPVEYIEQYQVGARCRQVRCDSKTFDPEPHRNSVDLAFIDGAHTDDYVRSDTEKIAAMMTPRGLVFWHDYGGKGRFRSISLYLHELSRRFPVYRIPGTTLAWAPAEGVRTLAAEPVDRGSATYAHRAQAQI